MYSGLEFDDCKKKISKLDNKNQSQRDFFDAHGMITDFYKNKLNIKRKDKEPISKRIKLMNEIDHRTYYNNDCDKYCNHGKNYDIRQITPQLYNRSLFNNPDKINIPSDEEIYQGFGHPDTLRTKPKYSKKTTNKEKGLFQKVWDYVTFN